jgi:hypothetical protein
MPAPLHAGKHGADGVEHGGEVDGQNGVPPVYRKALGGCDILDAGVVDKNVDRSKVRLGIPDQRLALTGMGKIGRVKEYVDTVFLLQAL